MPVIDQLFASLRAQRRKALMPFVTAGDPDLEFTAAVLAELVARGSSLCEVGIPYSDPIADGPVIQASYTRALAHKIKLAQILAMLAGVTPRLTAPTVTMVSYAIILRHGLDRYVAEAQRAVEETAELSAICRKADFSLVQLVTPLTPRDRALKIAASSTGFLYYVSVTGITGERTELPQSLIDSVGWLREQTPLPICIGFGISTPEHVKKLAPVADGLIVGSAVVRRMAQASTKPRDAVLKDVGDYVESLIKALA